MGPVGAAAIGLGANLLGDLFSSGLSYESSKKLQDRQNAWNQEMAAWQNQVNIQNWQMQNEYNTPANQVQRLLEAGLNPNLMYGNGKAATGVAESVAPADGYQSASAEPLNLSLGDVGGAFMDFYTKYKQNKYLDSQKEFVDAKKVTEQAEAVNRGIEGQIKNTELAQRIFNLDLDRETKDYLVRQVVANTKNTEQMFNNLQSQQRNLDSSTQLNEEKVREIQSRYSLTSAQVDNLRQAILESAARIAGIEVQSELNRSLTRGNSLSNTFNERTFDQRVQRVSSELLNLVSNIELTDSRTANQNMVNTYVRRYGIRGGSDRVASEVAGLVEFFRHVVDGDARY